jgi:hypothetical protein
MMKASAYSGKIKVQPKETFETLSQATVGK